MPLLIPVDEAARLIGVDRRRIYKLAEAGKLDLVKLGRNTTRVTGDSLRRLASPEKQEA